MFLKIYKYKNKNLKIIRFIYNNKNKYKKLLNKFKNIVEKDVNSFDLIYPWEDIEYFNNNKEVIILLYNKKIYGWANISYSKVYITSTKKYYYTSYLDKLTIRKTNQIKYLGTFMLYFIKKHCCDNKIIYDNKIVCPNILYIYSINQSIGFYEKINFLLKYSNIFYYISPNTVHNISLNKNIIESIKILSLFKK